MKNVRKYFLLICLFLVVMISLLIFFIFRYDKIHLLNRSRDLLSYLYTLDSGEYKFKSGVIYKDNNIINTNYYFDGKGDIKIDKYENVSFMIESSDYCVSKTALGNIKVDKNKCGEFVNIEASVTKNNNIVSFNVNKNDLNYMISNKDDFSGVWKHLDYKDNIIIKSFDEDKHYIWFKDSDGNVSDVYSYNVECFLSDKGEYTEDKYYCDGSIVSIDGINYIVLSDNEKEITLMKQNSIDIKLNHCTDSVSEYCYYDGESINKYKWSNSYINYYLNNEYVKTLNKDIISKLKEEVICDDFIENGCLNDEGCGGYTKDNIVNSKYTCNTYSKSKVRIMSYNEYVSIYGKLKNKSILKGNYWLISLGENGKGSSVQYDYNVYVLEEFTSKLDVKPVITILKY